MSLHKFTDKFDRADASTIGAGYTIPCGAVTLSDETVFPLNFSDVAGSPAWDGTTDQKTQVLYTAAEMDKEDYAVRAVWSHLDETIGISLDDLFANTQNDPSFTLLARMSKDPLLVDLGTDEQPACWDQGYGLRVTCPREGTVPILKVIKFTPRALTPGISPPASTEPDGAVVLGSLTLTQNNLNLDPNWDEVGNPPYRGFVQSMRMRIRRADDQVIIEAYLNDRNTHTPILKVVDYQHPLWGVVGVPGFEFLSAAKNTQSGTSPFALEAVASMLCHLFEVETVKEPEHARISHPANRWTYSRVAERVILLVEKQGDAKFTASLHGQTKRAIYLDFVYEAEREMLRREGYWRFTRRTERVHLTNGEPFYELPENVAEIIQIKPGNWRAPPLAEMADHEFNRQLAAVQTESASGGTGRPRLYRLVDPGPNDRLRVQVYPIPSTNDSAVGVVGEDGLPLYFTIDYHGRMIEPSDPDAQVPFIPQAHIDCLSWMAASLAMVLDTDAENAATMRNYAEQKFASLIRENNRKIAGRQTVMRSVADVLPDSAEGRFPTTRASQLGQFL